MGNYSTSTLRRTMRNDDIIGLREILEDAGPGAADLINEDYTSDCLFNCTRNVQVSVIFISDS